MILLYIGMLIGIGLMFWARWTSTNADQWLWIVGGFVLVICGLINYFKYEKKGPQAS